MRALTASDRCIAAIKDFEGFRPAAYEDVVGVWTIGYGETNGVRKGDTISEADAALKLAERATTLSTIIGRSSSRSLTQGQLDALTDFAYNLGLGALLHSSLWRFLEAGQTADAAAEFSKWCHAGGKVVEGLLKRRFAERAWFLELAQTDKIAA